jgi:SAM-dependent methyltransferase
MIRHAVVIVSESSKALPNNDEDDDDDNALTARSSFGTKQYWDDVYSGFGDFPSDEYSWYYGYDEIKLHLKLSSNKQVPIFLPGIGNDPILLDLIQAGYQQLTAQDYSEHAIERQRELLERVTSSSFSGTVELSHGNVQRLPESYNQRFDVILEKGLLDAVYLSGDGQVEKAVASLIQTLRPNGLFVSVSGVVPEVLRQELFPSDKWIWKRDGSKDLKAGCFIFQKKAL